MKLSEVPCIPSRRASSTGRLVLVLLGLVAVVQAGILGVAVYQRATSSPPARVYVELPEPMIPDPAAFAPPRPVPSPTPAFVPGPSWESPTADLRVQGLLEQARELRHRGDTQGALVKLGEARALQESNAAVLSELAAVYESIGLSDRAMALWRQIAAMDQQAGALAELAKIKLGLGDPRVPQGELPPSASLPLADAHGLQPGSVLGMIDVRKLDLADPEADQSIRLRIGIKAREGVDVDVHAVVIQVFFYDLLEGEHIVQTDARVSSQWVTPPVDWTDDRIEILEVGYEQSRREENVPGDFPEESREFYGYIIRIYYQDGLEDVRAEPVALLTLFPPPIQVEE